MPFAIPNIRIEDPEALAHTRIGWFRSVANLPHAFAVQSFVAELAAAAGRDPKEFLLAMIGPARVVAPKMMSDTFNEGESPERYAVNTGRLRNVIERAAKEAGWGRSLPKGSGLGLAAHYSFVSYVAVVVEVAVDDKGEVTHSACRYGSRLRGDHLSGPRARTNGGGLRHGDKRRRPQEPSHSGPVARSRTIFTNMSAAHACGAARDSGTYNTGRLQPATGRGGRAGCTANHASAMQRNLCGNRQAHSSVAHRRSA